ncbi:MAG TPA: hypothetical protein PK286_06175, partial [Devosia sp.]|nr:hypothetical protein [Devosia sp.]
GHKSEPVPSAIDGVYPGTVQRIHKGSYGTVPVGGLLDGAGGFSLSFWLWPTLPGPDEQGLVTWRDAAGAGLGVYLSPDGRIVCRGTAGLTLTSARKLAPKEWYRVDVELRGAELALTITAGRYQPAFADPEILTAFASADLRPTADATLRFAAASIDGRDARGLYNGKLARPEISAGNRVLARWDFARDPGTRDIRDTAGDRHGQFVNRPMRSATGPGWPGASASTEAKPETHDAIHFHDDDVSDAGWAESFRLELPPDLPSGIYAAKLLAGDAVDHLPFFVCPPARTKRPALAVLIPTMSYLAYANESLDVADTVQLSPAQDMSINAGAYAYVAENGLKSLYDLHRDGSGIVYGTLRRPIIDLRPNARCRTFDAPHQFAADLHLVDWLTTRGYDFDIITDELLHAEGRALLEPYSVVVSGSHPEYWTAPMLDGRDAWLDAGGRLMYLGGNGFYWVTGVAADEPDLIEVRRYSGTRTSSGAIGEESLSTTGERGGLWRERGRSPHSRVGIGFSGQGFDRGAPYRRTEASYSPEWSWVFAGVDAEIVGAGQALVLGHGAAGFEVDGVDARYGTAAHTVVLGSTDGFTDAYQGAIEARNSLDPWSGGSDRRSGVRSDIVLTPGPNGGAVFAAGSITWSSTLSAQGYDSDTSRITANVIDAFLDPARRF